MELNGTWTARIQRGRTAGRRAALVGLTALALLGGAAGIKVFLAPDRPDVAAIAGDVADERDQVGAFAADFVLTWLTATSSCARHDDHPPAADCRDTDRTALRRYLTLPEDTTLTLPSTPAAAITSPRVVSVIDAGAVGEATMYAAVVSVDERPYPSAAPTHAFYRVPISLWHYQTRAVTLPARINGPGPGADVALGYRQALSTDGPIFAVVGGFVRTYLTSTTGLDRYAVAGTPLAAVGGYQSAVVTSAATAERVPDDAPPGTQIHVLATVLAQTSQFATITMTYPLTLQNSGGTWMVAAVDPMPRSDTAATGPR